MSRRGEILERGFAHTLESGGMRRTHLRDHDNIPKRIDVATAFTTASLPMGGRPTAPALSTGY